MTSHHSQPDARTDRRGFLAASGLLAGGAMLGTLPAFERAALAVPQPTGGGGGGGGGGAGGGGGKVFGVGIIGMGKRAFEMLGPLMNRADCRVVGICDVDGSRRAEGVKRVTEQAKKAGGGGGGATTECRSWVDYREMLAIKGLDAVVIASPDHWHVNQVIDAAKAKKDIYCEKPLTFCLEEGRRMIRAVRKYDVVFQTGSQQRTEFDHRFVAACEAIRNGRLGKLFHVYVGVGLPSKPCDLGEEKMEPGLDWDRWLGPAPQRPYHPELSPRGVHGHYPNWRLYSEYSGGMMTDFGAHNFDIAQWALDMDESGPIEVIPPADPKAEYGCRLVYASGLEIIHGGPAGVTFVGEKGTLHVWRDRTVCTPADLMKAPLSDKEKPLPRHKSHLDNWFDCLRSRQRPICDVEVGARSNACAHLCNLAYWHKRKLKWDPRAWEFPGDAEANRWLDYERRKGYEMPAI